MKANIQHLENLKEDLKVKVTYTDGKGEHVTTVGELREKWAQDTEEWQLNFFESLDTEGIARSNFGGTYELI